MRYTYEFGGLFLQLQPEETQFLLANGMTPRFVPSRAEGFLSLEHDTKAIEMLLLDGGFSISVENDPASQYLANLKGEYKTPLPWQANMVRLGVNNYRWYLPGFMSSGKTATSYWIIDILMNAGITKRTLIVTTLAGMAEAWKNDHFKTLLHRSMVLLTGDKKAKLRKLATNADIYIINYDGIEGIQTELGKAGFNLVIWDESHTVKSLDAKRTLVATILMRTIMENSLLLYGTPCRCGEMTGTPSAQGVADLFGQAMLLGFGDRDGWVWDDKQQTYLRDFSWYMEEMENEFCFRQGFKLLDRDEKVPDIIKLMRPAFAPKISDILAAMPEQRVHFVECPMGDEQRTVFDQLKVSMFAEFLNTSGGMASRVLTNALALSNLLIQVASSFLYGNALPSETSLDTLPEDQAKWVAHYIGDPETIDSKNAFIIEYINNGAKSGVLIVAKHTAAIDRTYNLLIKHCAGRAEVKKFDKTLNSAAKSKMLSWFNKCRDDGKIPVIISQYVRVAESVNLHEGGTTIFLSAVFKMAPAMQVMFRVRRISNKKPFVNLLLLHSCNLELVQYKRMMTKMERMVQVQADMVDMGTSQFHIPALLGRDDDVDIATALAQELGAKVDTQPLTS